MLQQDPAIVAQVRQAVEAMLSCEMPLHAPLLNKMRHRWHCCCTQSHKMLMNFMMLCDDERFA
jgi:hypothetical protein